MKHFFTRLLSLLLTLILLFTAIPFTVAGEDNIASDKATVVKAFDSAALSSHSAKQVGEGSTLGLRLSYGAPFNKVTVCMPTWSTTDSSATLALYKWNTDYETSIAGEPVSSKKFEPLRDNAHNALSFDEQPAGEYVLVIKDVKGQVGVWQMSPATVNGYAYDGAIETQVDWEVNVTFTKTPKVPFLEMSSVTEAIDGNHTAPDEYVIPEDSLLNTHKVMPDTWVFTDGLGRTSLTYEDVGGIKDDKTIAMFYWTWHGDLGGNEPLNITEFMKEHPDAKNDYDHPAWPTSGTAYFWNEPVYGYYKTNDAWVLRKQAELLANAGVDTIFTDNTNGNYTWRTSYIPLYETWSDAQTNGAVDVPKVSFLLPFGPNDGSKEQIEALYRDIYRRDKYQNLWFYWDGKPMLMGYNNNISTATNLGKEINRFFTWRAGQPGYLVEETGAKQWGWLSTYPQALYAERGAAAIKRGDVEQMTVGVAVNHNYKTHNIAAMNEGEFVIGRSYSSKFENRFVTEGSSASLWGYNFSEQFDYALEVDPEVIFITGWNEWTAGRHEEWGGSENAFPDQFTDEYSRDLEPTKGALKDHYYYLLVNYVRQYKGASPIPTPSTNATIDLSAGEDQWSTVEPYYAAYIGNTKDRDASGYGSLHYTETSGRNDIIGAQVARDDDYVYFHVECKENITSYTDALWMTLYIDSDQQNQGWETFEYVINKSAASADTVVLEKFTGNGYETTKVADCAYTVDGRYMTVKVAKSDLSLSGDNYTINFSWTDNVHDEGDYTKFSGDIMDFYISGDVAPGARFKYSYISTTENAGKEVESETEAGTQAEAPTDAPVEKPTDAPAASESETQPEARGCGASVTPAAFGMVTVVMAACGLAKTNKRKKKDD
ncbi:MAG: hypothetical protein IJW00_02590 [Clostridia bacterium]|nr:hypothetical protein [Clostridia bacterium]